MAQKVIFLDFDGVVHSLNEALDGAAFSREDYLVRLVQDLLYFKHTVKIVISSDWRYSYDLNELKSFLPKLSKLNLEWDTTGMDDISNKGGSRFYEITNYIHSNLLDFKDCLILDDNHTIFQNEENERIFDLKDGCLHLREEIIDQDLPDWIKDEYISFANQTVITENFGKDDFGSVFDDFKLLPRHVDKAKAILLK